MNPELHRARAEELTAQADELHLAIEEAGGNVDEVDWRRLDAKLRLARLRLDLALQPPREDPPRRKPTSLPHVPTNEILDWDGN
uniref:hypothetical protein n=1 Tax=Paractinoplanes polyasparticus TaxID=2856853 RepID=UPI001C84CA18|nr:hypothetical protein [Actinoplanes polyasparticus]